MELQPDWKPVAFSNITLVSYSRKLEKNSEGKMSYHSYLKDSTGLAQAAFRV